jgi:hypothetical protein
MIIERWTEDSPARRHEPERWVRVATEGRDLVCKELTLPLDFTSLIFKMIG